MLTSAAAQSNRQVAVTSEPAPAGLTIVKTDFDTETDLRREYGVTVQHTFVQVGPDGAAVKKWGGSGAPRTSSPSSPDTVLALVGALVAGMLTTLAPCVLPLLPVIVGGSVAGVAGSSDRTAATRRALVIAVSLGASVFVFTLLLRASTALLGIPPDVWSVVSGGLLVVLGLLAVFPQTWERASGAMQLQARSTRGLSRARGRHGLLGEVLTGAALGPVFTSCSPLYGYVLVTVLPRRPAAVWRSSCSTSWVCPARCSRSPSRAVAWSGTCGG